MSKAKDKTAADDGWRQRLGFIVLSAAVLGTLLLAAVLQSSAEPPQESPAADSRPSDPLPSQSPSLTELDAPSFTTVEQSGLDGLVLRASEDAQRFAQRGEGWTLQFMVGCEPRYVHRVLDALGDRDELYVLPVMLDERPCFRVCWGLFASRDRALAVSALPAALTALTERPTPLALESALE